MGQGNHHAEKQMLDEELAYPRWLIREGVISLEQVSDIFERSLHVFQNESMNDEQQEIEKLLSQYGLPLKPE